MQHCRICSGNNLTSLLSLGEMSLSGVFPEEPFAKVSSGILELFLCHDCTLVQLGETFPAEEMYGENYGYRSGLNQSMLDHLREIVDYATSLVALSENDVVVDIGSNDGSLLRHYEGQSLNRIGIDPTASKFLEFYDEGCTVVADFFNKENFQKASRSNAKLITSIAMLYDLEDPVSFAKDVETCLSEDGVWVAEQSYMPWMVLTGAYDTICHEHLEYYSLTSLQYLADKADLKVIDAIINDANGGSIRVAFAKKSHSIKPSSGVVELARWENELDLGSKEFFQEFTRYVSGHGLALRELVESLRDSGKKVVALGASTKGSIVLQHSKLDSAHLDYVADVNPFKFGRYMSNSDLQIVPEGEQALEEIDFVLILPWHFKATFRRILEPLLAKGGGIIWPLPAISIETRAGLTSPFCLDIENLTNTPLRNTQSF